MAAESRPGEGADPACACPKDAAESGQGHSIAGTSGARWSRGCAGCVSGRGGDNLSRVQLSGRPPPTPQHLVSALARAVGAGRGCAARWQRPRALRWQGGRRAAFLPRHSGRGGSAAAEPWAVPLPFGVAVCRGALSFTSAFSPLGGEAERAQLCHLSWKFGLRLCKCLAVQHPPASTPAFATKYKSFFKCLQQLSAGSFWRSGAANRAQASHLRCSPHPKPSQKGLLRVGAVGVPPGSACG